MVSFRRGLTQKLSTPFFDNEWAWFFDEMGNEEVLFEGVA